MKPGTAYDTQDSSGELSGSIFKTGVACAHTWYGLAGDAPDNILRSNNIIPFFISYILITPYGMVILYH